MIKLKCDICGFASWHKYLNVLVKCDHCGLVRADMDMSVDELKEYYGHEYYFGNEYIDYLKEKEALEKNFSRRIKYLLEKKVIVKNSKVVEVGCAFGFFLKLISKYCPDAIGYDVTKEGVAYASKILKVKATNDDFLKHKGNADIVFMWDVIEHLSSPDSYIKKIYSVLNKNGYLVLTTGDISSLMAKIQKGKWRLIHPPTHVFYFDKSSMKKLLEKNGFSVISIKYPSIYRNLGTVFNKLFKVNVSWLYKLDIGINSYDIMEVVAIKN